MFTSSQSAKRLLVGALLLGTVVSLVVALPRPAAAQEGTYVCPNGFASRHAGASYAGEPRANLPTDAEWPNADPWVVEIHDFDGEGSRGVTFTATIHWGDGLSDTVSSFPVTHEYSRDAPIGTLFPIDFEVVGSMPGNGPCSGTYVSNQGFLIVSIPCHIENSALPVGDRPECEPAFADGSTDTEPRPEVDDDLIEVPWVVAQDADVAVGVVTGKGLTVTIKEVEVRTLEEWNQVQVTDPIAGTMVDPGSDVTVVIGEPSARLWDIIERELGYRPPDDLDAQGRRLLIETVLNAAKGELEELALAEAASAGIAGTGFVIIIGGVLFVVTVGASFLQYFKRQSEADMLGQRSKEFSDKVSERLEHDPDRPEVP